MSESNESALSGVSTDEPIAQPAISTDPDTGTDQEATETEQAEPTEQEKPKISPYHKRIETLLQKEREANQRAAQAEARLLDFQQNRTPPTAGVPDGYVPAAEVDARVAQTIAHRDFNASCDAIAVAAETRHGSQLETARNNFGLLADREQMTGLLEMITGADLGNDDAADLYVRIGNNPEEIARLLSLSPSRRAMEITKMAVNKPAAVASKAPSPIRPITPKGGGEVDPNNLDGAAFTKWYESEQKKRRG